MNAVAVVVPVLQVVHVKIRIAARDTLVLTKPSAWIRWSDCRRHFVGTYINKIKP